MRFTGVGGVALLCAWAQIAHAGTPPLGVHSKGKVQAKFPLGLAGVAPVRGFEVHEPLSGQRMVFSGVPLLPVLDAAFGPSWRDRDSVVFHCSDGYQSRVDVQDVLRYKPALAHAIQGAGRFSLTKTDGTQLNLGPYYVVWDSLKRPELQKTGTKGWAYQVVAIESVQAKVALSYAQPPPRASGAVLKGYEHFKTYCVACHSINGAGGRVGPELNYPASVTEYISPKWLKRWLLNPTSVRSRTPMPGLPKTLPGRQRIAKEIIGYLTAMQDRKLAPKGP